MSAAEIQDRWEAEHEKHPTTAKATFLRNCLFGGSIPDDLIDWLIAQEDLHGQVHESSALAFRHELGTPPPNADGMIRWDETVPHIRIRVQIEVVKDGRSRLDDRPRWDDE